MVILASHISHMSSSAGFKPITAKLEGHGYWKSLKSGRHQTTEPLYMILHSHPSPDNI